MCKKIFILFLILCLLTTLIGCRGAPTVPPISPEPEGSFAVNITKEAENKLEDMADSGMSMAQSIESIIEWLEEQSDVTQVTCRYNLIEILFSSGINSFIQIYDSSAEFLPLGSSTIVKSSIPERRQEKNLNVEKTKSVQTNLVKSRSESITIIENRKVLFWEPLPLHIYENLEDFYYILVDSPLDFPVPDIKYEANADINSLRNITDYGLVVFHAHGRGGKWLVTGEAPIIPYKLSPDRIGLFTSIDFRRLFDPVSFYSVSYKWFEENLQGNFVNTVIISLSCESTMTTKLWDVFHAKGAGAYYGYDGVTGFPVTHWHRGRVFRGLTEGKTTGQSFDFPVQIPVDPWWLDACHEASLEGETYTLCFEMFGGENLTFSEVSDIPDDYIVVFEDPNLEQVVRETINKPTGLLYLSDVIGITTLFAFFRGIESLEGIQYLQDLQYLQLTANQVSDISPLANLTNLQELYFGCNQVSDISALANLTNLRNLFFRNNQVSDISALANLTNLRWLEFPDNQVLDISALSNLTNLQDLGFHNNQVSDISALANLTNLRWLGFPENQVSDISALSNLTNLQGLIFGRNQISDISALANLTNLQDLGFHNNQVSDISALSNLTKLDWLDFTDNQVLDISGLVNNHGLGPGDFIGMQWNFLDLTPGSQNMQDIETLISRGVEVLYSPQNEQGTTLTSPIIYYFTANPSTIIEGDSSILNWEVSNATNVTINQGIGSVSLFGSTSVSPTASTTYTLTAYNVDVSSNATVIVTVVPYSGNGTVKPDPPILISPGTSSAPGPTIDTLTPTLIWQTVSNADYYALAISIYPYGTANIVYNPQQLYGNSITVPSGVLEAGKRYRWNMQAYNSAGWSDISETLYFQTGSAEITARIDSYFPSSKITVSAGQSFTISTTFTNTGDTASYFYPGVSIWNSNGNLVFDDWSGQTYLNPGQQSSASWNHTIYTPGEYWLQFGVWDETKSKLLDKKPSPSQNLIRIEY